MTGSALASTHRRLVFTNRVVVSTDSVFASINGVLAATDSVPAATRALSACHVWPCAQGTPQVVLRLAKLSVRGAHVGHAIVRAAHATGAETEGTGHDYFRLVVVCLVSFHNYLIVFGAPEAATGFAISLSISATSLRSSGLVFAG